LCADFGRKWDGFAVFPPFITAGASKMLRGFWQKVGKAPGPFVLRGLVGEGVQGQRVISGRQEMGRECSGIDENGN